MEEQKKSLPQIPRPKSVKDPFSSRQTSEMKRYSEFVTKGGGGDRKK